MSHELIGVLSALAEPTRLATMQVLWDGEEHCICELLPRMQVSQSRMSRHMATLKAAGLVVDRRDRQWVRYRLNPDLPAPILAVVTAVVAAARKMPERTAA